jgi:NADPH:quinone reductase-like Zn-dependent oxidoreductase
MPRVVRFHETGGPEVLRIEDLPQRDIGADEVRIRVDAIGINRAEVLYRSGRYLETPELPSRVGYEAAGHVDAVGGDVTHVRAGDRVAVVPSFSMNAYGVYGEEAVVPASAVVRTPEGVSAPEAAALWMAYLTAYGALIDIGGLGADDAVVIPAASSSVGLAAIQIANRVGATPIATTRTTAKRDAIRNAGAPHVIVTDEDDLVAKVRWITGGRGARIVFDPVGGPFVDTLADATADGGILFVYGILSLRPTPFPVLRALRGGLALRGYTLFEIASDPARLDRGIQFVTSGIAEGSFKPVIARTFAFEAIQDAHRFMESSEQFGKIVVTVP